jgi:hypothetical protein
MRVGGTNSLSTSVHVSSSKKLTSMLRPFKLRRLRSDRSIDRQTTFFDRLWLHYNCTIISLGPSVQLFII